MPKYKLNYHLLNERHNIAKLERDGFKREDISRALYRETEGATREERAEIMDKLHDRSEK